MIARHFDTAAQRWTSKYEDRPSFIARLEIVGHILLKELEGREHPDVLDIGTGSGIFARLCSRSGANVVGIDSSVQMIKAAQRHGAEQDRILDHAGFPARSDAAPRYLQGTLPSPALEPASFDLVLLISVVEYQERPDLLIRQAADLLRSNGRLIYSTPSETTFVRIVERIVKRLPFPYAVWPRLDVQREYLSLRQYHSGRTWRRVSETCGLRVHETTALPLGVEGIRSRLGGSILTVASRD